MIQNNRSNGNLAWNSGRFYVVLLEADFMATRYFRTVITGAQIPELNECYFWKKKY